MIVLNICLALLGIQTILFITRSIALIFALEKAQKIYWGFRDKLIGKYDKDGNFVWFKFKAAFPREEEEMTPGKLNFILGPAWYFKFKLEDLDEYKNYLARLEVFKKENGLD